jgi:hypothetical protein
MIAKKGGAIGLATRPAIAPSLNLQIVVSCSRRIFVFDKIIEIQCQVTQKF